MSKARKLTSAVMNIDDLAKLFELPTSEEIDEAISDSGDAYGYAHKRAIAAGESEEKAEASAIAAEEEERAEAYLKWYDAVEYVARSEFEEHGLQLMQAYKRIRGKKVDSERPYELRVIPVESWRDAAGKIMNTINGVGMFEFSSVKEFMDSGPYTAREAVLRHTHWINRRAEVYGDHSPRSKYDGRMS